MFEIRWTICRICFVALWMAALSTDVSGHSAALTMQDAQNSQTPKSAELLKRLLDRDRQFDDAQFRYEKTRTESIDLQVLTLQELERRAENPLIDNKSDGFTEILRGIGTMPPAFPAEYSCNETLSVRGGVAAFEHTHETQRVADIDENTQRVVDFYSGRAAPPERWSNSKGLMMSSLVLPNQEILLKASGAGPLAATERQKMTIQFMMGHGFGTRLKKIHAVTKESGQTIAEGVIEVWSGDESRCRLVIDDTLIVREATIESDVKGNRNSFIIHTDGVLKHTGAILAMRTEMREITGFVKGIGW